MEPVSAVGAVGSILGILHTVTSAILKLREIKQKFQESEIYLVTLVGELEASKEALEQIKAFIEENLPSKRIQMDLGATLESCRIMIQFIETKVSSINPNDPSLRDRINLILEDGRTEGYLSKLSRHIAALGVMINVLQCRDRDSQVQILEDTPNRQLLSQVKEDSTSLVVLYDDTSSTTQRSITSTASSRFSLRFPFDLQLLSTQPYERAFRSLLKLTRTSRSFETNQFAGHSRFPQTDYERNSANTLTHTLRSLSASAASTSNGEARARRVPWNRRSIPSNFRSVGISRPDAIYAS